MEPCSPRLVEGHEAPTYACTADERDPWSLVLEVEAFTEADPDLRETVAVLQGVLLVHDQEHEQPRPRPVRNAKPKFGAGLGMNGAKITQVGPSATGTG